MLVELMLSMQNVTETVMRLSSTDLLTVTGQWADSQLAADKWVNREIVQLPLK